MRALVAEALEASQRPLNPVHAGALTGEYVDPSARAAENASVEARSLESVVTMHTLEGLLALLTPRDMLVLTDALLGILCIPAMAAVEAGDEAILGLLQVGPFGDEITAFYEKNHDELRRALYHVSSVMREEGLHEDAGAAEHPEQAGRGAADGA